VQLALPEHLEHLALPAPLALRDQPVQLEPQDQLDLKG
jgi:hypothetical protein